MDVDVSEHIYFSTNLSLNLETNPRFQKIFVNGSPGYELPSAKVIAGKRLFNCQQRIKEVQSVKQTQFHLI